MGIGVGVAKELHDSRRGGTGFSAADIKADALGVAAGAGIIFSVRRKF